MKIKSYAKVNIFLKIVGIKNNYHLLSSRFAQLSNLYDEIEFVKKDQKSNLFELVGNFGCKLEKNTIYKAYNALYKSGNEKLIKDFFYRHKTVVKKNIPEFAGLGGGSSNAAYFMILLNKILNLGLNKETLANISLKIGADLPFFIYDFNSANVTGIGENVNKFDEKLPLIITETPNIRCDTTKVYAKFRKDYITKIDENKKLAQKLSEMKSDEILKNFAPQSLNDLLLPAIALYPKLQGYQKEGYCFSGSGSTFFKMESS